MFENILFKLNGCHHQETKLLRCQSYESGNIIKWKKQTKFSWSLLKKCLKNIHIYDSQKIRSVLKDIITNNQTLFNSPNLFITSFGSDGKSGGKISYELRHTKLVSDSKFIESWKLINLPEGSVIIFVEDLIGTGSQSTEYIIKKLNMLLSSSYKPYLLTICATDEGIKKVEKETNFKVINGVLLEEKQYYNYSDLCDNFTKKEKNILFNLNKMLKNPNKEDYDRGLLISFHYSPPNNSMPILWKNNYKYFDYKQQEQVWNALIPRQY
jgi:hypothetical protein